MKSFLALAIVFVSFSTASAQSIKEYVAFERAKMVTYADAVKIHEKTKKPVIVWVQREAFNAWSATKDLGIHCFVKDFPNTKAGDVVVGGDRNGEFVRLETISNIDDYTIQAVIERAIKSEVPPPPQVAPAIPTEILPLGRMVQCNFRGG